MPSIVLDRVSLSFDGGTRVLEEATARLDDGWTGLTGPNGAGKTSLLRLVTGELVPGGGRVRLEPDGARVVVCPQEVETESKEIIAFSERSDGDARALRDLLRLQLADLARWSTLSPGERKRWQLGAALIDAPDVLLLDEPTNHLDADARGWVLAALQGFRGAGVVVSHDRAWLDGLTLRTVRLADGVLELLPLPWSEARAEWDRRQARAFDAREAAQDAVRRLERRLADERRTRDAAERGRSTRHRMRNAGDNEARGMGAKTLAGWAEAKAGRSVAVTREALERARGAVPRLDVQAELGRSVFARFEPPRQPVLTRLDADVIEVGGRPLLRDVHLQVGRDDRIVLRGPNGAGKTTLFDALRARAVLDPARVLVLPQELTESDRKTDLALLHSMPRDERGRVLQVVAALGVAPERLLATPRPSPGESRKLRLALGLGRNAALVALDEPTNHLDLPSIERLEAALKAFPGALLLVTHDDRLAESVARTCWRIEGGRVEVESIGEGWRAG